MVSNLIAIINGEMNMTAIVTLGEKGYAVSLHDNDAEMTLETVTIFKTEKEALEYAETIKK